MFDKDDKRQPMVDRTGKFFLIEDLDPKFVSEKVNTEKYKEFAGRYVKMLTILHLPKKIQRSTSIFV